MIVVIIIDWHEKTSNTKMSVFVNIQLGNNKWPWKKHFFTEAQHICLHFKANGYDTKQNVKPLYNNPFTGIDWILLMYAR